MKTIVWHTPNLELNKALYDLNHIFCTMIIIIASLEAIKMKAVKCQLGGSCWPSKHLDHPAQPTCSLTSGA